MDTVSEDLTHNLIPVPFLTLPLALKLLQRHGGIVKEESSENKAFFLMLSADVTDHAWNRKHTQWNWPIINITMFRLLPCNIIINNQIMEYQPGDTQESTARDTHVPSLDGLYLGSRGRYDRFVSMTTETNQNKRAMTSHYQQCPTCRTCSVTCRL